MEPIQLFGARAKGKKRYKEIHCEIKYAVAEYIESLPLSSGETLKVPKSLSGKINSIFELLTNAPKPTSRKRPYSTIATNSTDSVSEFGQKYYIIWCTRFGGLC